MFRERLGPDELDTPQHDYGMVFWGIQWVGRFSVLGALWRGSTRESRCRPALAMVGSIQLLRGCRPSESDRVT